MEQLLMHISRRLLYLFALMLAAGIAWSYYYEMPNVVAARGAVASSGGVYPISSLSPGHIVRLLAWPGDIVSRGQPVATVWSAAEGSEVELRAAADGTYVPDASKKPGSEVKSGEAVGRIRADGLLRIEAWVDGSQIGRMTAGMEVRFELDAYPKRDYGAILGNIETVSAIPSVGQADRPLYRITVAPSIVPAHLEQRLQPDLEGTAYVITEQRRLLSLLIPINR